MIRFPLQHDRFRSRKKYNDNTSHFGKILKKVWRKAIFSNPTSPKPNTTMRSVGIPILCAISVAATPLIEAATSSSGPITSPAGRLPAGEFVAKDGMAPRTFRIVLDKVVKQGHQEPNRLEEIDPLPSVAALEAYIEAEEQADPYTFVGMLLAPVDLDARAAEGDDVQPLRDYRLLTRKLAVRLAEEFRSVEQANAIAAAAGLRHLRTELTEGWTAFATESSLDVFDALSALKADPAIEEAQFVLGHSAALRACDYTFSAQFFPNDPWYGWQTYLNPPVPPPAPPPNLWGPIINVRPVWENTNPFTGLPFLRRSYTGRGSNIGIADDGLYHDHPDLRRNVNKNAQNDWIGDDGDPSGGGHGTRAAGIIAGIGRNREGITGIAPRASVSGLRFFPDLYPDDEILSSVMSYKSATLEILYHGWGPGDAFLNATGPGPLTLFEMEKNARFGRIMVMGSGNGGSIDNSNYDGYASHRSMIAVGAINDLGLVASYSEPGANILCAGLADDTGPAFLVSTNGPDDYIIGGMDGTSYAAATVTGVIALMLEANGRLELRDIQEILAASSLGGAPNGGHPSPVPGIEDSYTYIPHFTGSFVGYGLINPVEAVRLAEIWPTLPEGPGYVSRTRRVNFNDPIEQNILTPLRADLNRGEPHVFEFDFGIYDDIRVEHVVVETEWREGDAPQPLTMFIESAAMPRNVLRIPPQNPDPTLSTLSLENTDVNIPEVWEFTSVAFWGRSSAEDEDNGIWRVYMGVDEDEHRGRILDKISVTIYGSPKNEVPEIDNVDIFAADQPDTPNPTSTTEVHDLTIKNIEFNDPDGDEVTLIYRWQELHPDSVTWIDIPGQTGEVQGECDWTPIADANVEINSLTTGQVVESTAIPIGQPAQFTSRSFDTGGQIVSHFWTFGDGSTSDLENPTHVYGSIGGFTVSLTVEDNTGNTDTYTFGVQSFRPDQLPNPLPILLAREAMGDCIYDGEATLPASATTGGTVYRAEVTAYDRFRQGETFITQPVIVHSEPVRNTFVGDDYYYDADFWITTAPPDTFPRFARANEVSQGVLGPEANGEWIEFLMVVESDLRGYHLTNAIAAFDLVFTQNDLWAIIPAGTLIVIYNGDYRDGVLPPDDTDVSDGVLVVNSNDPRYFILPTNEDGWGEVSNGNPAHLIMLDLFCRPIDGVAWNYPPNQTLIFDNLPIVTVGDIADNQSAYYWEGNLAGMQQAGNWLITEAGLNTSPTQPPPPPFPATFPDIINPDAEGTTPGAPNNTNNLNVIAEAIGLGLTSIPRYSILEGPAWLSIDLFTGELTGTPGPGDVGVFTVTLQRAHSFGGPGGTPGGPIQTFELSVAPGPPLDPDADEEPDGIVNLFEVAFVGDPNAADSPAEIMPTVDLVDIGGGQMSAAIRYRRPVGGNFDPVSQTYTWVDLRGDTYIYEAQCATDLMVWSGAGDLAGSLFQDSAVDLGDGAELATFRLLDAFPGVDPTKYLRIQVTRIPAPAP